MAETEQELSTFIAGWLSSQLEREVGAEAEFAGLGLDSLDLVRLADALAERIGVDELPVSLVFDHPSIPALSAHLVTLESK